MLFEIFNQMVKNLIIKYLNPINSCLCLSSFEIYLNSCTNFYQSLALCTCFCNTSQASRILSKSYNSSASTRPTTPFYNGESSGESLPKPVSEPINPILIPFNELKNATRNFRRDSIIREGGFCTVFKGWIKEHTLNAAKPGSGMAVAIKKINPKGLQVSNEWLRQVNYLSHFRHPNLFKFIACCTEGNNLLLVFEFMPKGSLENHLFRRSQCLSWCTRIKVAVDTARALSFLHDAKYQVIYRNVMSAAILLDEDFNVKLAPPPPYDTHMTTQGVCRQGYSAPEYIAAGHLTEKCDVYAFGVVLLELLSGRRATEISNDEHHNMVDWARPYLYNKRNVHSFMDTRFQGRYHREGAVIVSNLALQCVSCEPQSRPGMAEVLATLEPLQDSYKKSKSRFCKFAFCYI